MEIRVIASIAHEINRTLCLHVGDESQVPWCDAAEWQKASAVDGVIAIRDGKITAPYESHEQWAKHKKADGWVYGSGKDPEKKTHPCLVPFSELPPEQQLKDHLFFQTVKHLLMMSK